MNDAIIVLIAGIIFILCFLFWLKSQMNKIKNRISIRSNEWQQKISKPFTNWFCGICKAGMSEEHKLIIFLLHDKVINSHSYYLQNKDLPVTIKDILSEDEIKMMNKIKPFNL